MPFQAISALMTFVGREVELEDLKRNLLNNGHAAICGVHGMAGVGKTSLAAHIAYQLRSHFPDGVLWARLDTSDTLAILGQFADAYGKDVRQHNDIESRAAIVRSLLEKKQALIVLDNAENSAQVRPLLPPTGSRCAVLVTTRHSNLPVLDGWTPLFLEPFGPESDVALKLFEQFLGSEKVVRHRYTFQQIAQLVGYLPLALAIVAGQLRSEPHHSVAGFLETLRQTGARLESLARDDHNVRLSFSLSYNSLPTELQILFDTLGIFGGPDFSTQAVAFITQTELAVAETYLRRLQNRSLIIAGHETRWRLIPCCTIMPA
jgi:hypothetical protein